MSSAMKIAYVIPGTGGAFYCQNCLRDDNLVRALEAAGHAVVRTPLYLPITRDGSEALPASPIFFGAVNVYLQEKSALFRRTPRWVDRLFDAPSMLRWASSMAGSTSARGLEELTLSMLAGEGGRQAKEVARCADWLAREVKPDVVHLSNALLLGLADAVKARTGAAVVCTLQDENVWVDDMDPDYGRATWKALADRGRAVDAFVSASRAFAETMAGKMNIPQEKMHVVEPGLDFTGYEPAARPADPPVLGYLSRMTESQGFDTAVEAFILLKRMPGLRALKFRATGGYTAEDQPLLKALLHRLVEEGLRDEVEIVPDYGQAGRLAFLQGLTALSVPVKTGAAFGVFMLESLACGVPVVQPRAGGFPEVLDVTGGGLLFEPNDAPSLARAAAPLLRRPRDARALGLAGRERVLEHFGAPALARRMMAVYETLGRDRSRDGGTQDGPD